MRALMCVVNLCFSLLQMCEDINVLVLRFLYKIYGKCEKSLSLTLSRCIQKILKRNDAHISESQEEISRFVSFFCDSRSNWYLKEVFKVGQCERNDVFSAIKKGRKKNVEQFAPQNSFDTCPRDLYIKHGHTQGFGDFRTNPYYVFSRGRGVKVWEFRVYWSAFASREREGYTRAHLRVKIYSLFFNGEISSSVLSSR